MAKPQKRTLKDLRNGNNKRKPIIIAKKQPTSEPAKQAKPKPRTPAGNTIETRENQIISAAMELAAEQIRNKTASAQVLTHFLKLGSTEKQLEKAKILKDMELSDAKRDELQSKKKVDEMYSKALAAMRIYNGSEAPEETIDNDD